jgi:hypothetical protein
MKSPIVLSVAWGEMKIDGGEGGIATGKDFKLFPGGGREWDWSETGTRHRPGIQPADVQELLDHGATVVVLSRGMDLVLQIDPATVDFLAARSVEVHALDTRAAVARYNELAEAGVAVGGLFHSTC